MVIVIAIAMFIIGLLIQAGAYYLGAKFTGNETPFKTLFVIALIGAALGAIPDIGWLLGSVAVLFLLAKWGRMDFWPDAVLTVVVAWAIQVGAGFVLVSLLASTAA